MHFRTPIVPYHIRNHMPVPLAVIASCASWEPQHCGRSFCSNLPCALRSLPMRLESRFVRHLIPVRHRPFGERLASAGPGEVLSNPITGC